MGPKESIEAPHPFPSALLTSPNRIFISSFIISFHNKLVNRKETVFLSSVSSSSKLIKPKERGWEPLIYSPSVRSIGSNNLDLQLASER